MSKNLRTRIICLLISISIFIGLVPTFSVSALGDFDISSPLISIPINNYITKLAPGILEKGYSFVDSNGKKNESFVIEVDPLNEKVSIEAMTPNDENSYGLQTVRKQADVLIAKGEQVVAGVNADFYNMATGEPSGVVVKDGVIIKNNPNSRKFFGVLKDGTPVIGDYNKFNELKDNIEEALGGNAILVKDGQVFETPQTGADKEPRTAVGIKADGKVIFLTVDGRQEPYSTGLSMEELAELMISMGAVQALNLDGGGSTTHLSRTPGSDVLDIKNRPSDNSERSVANSWMIVSKEPITHQFNSAYVTPNEKSFTPNSNIQFTAVGVDLAGASADLPKEGLIWSISDSSFGTIDENNGLFTSTGKLGQAKALLSYNGKVVGETNFEIEVPNEIYFYNSEISIDKNSSKSLGLTTLFNKRNVKYNANDIIWDVPEGMGTIDENGVLHTFDNSLSGEIKASIRGTNLSASVNVTVGQLPIILDDFEEGLGSWKASTANRGEIASVELTTYPNEPTRFGEHSLKLNYDFTNAQVGTTLGAYAGPTETVNVEGNPKAIGMWVYATEEANGYWLRMNLIAGDGKSKTIDLVNQRPGIDWTGWKYVEAEIPETYIGPFLLHPTQSIRIMSLKSGLEGEGPMTKGVLYIDNIRAVYGDKVDDLYPPIIDSISIADEEYNVNNVNITAKLYDYQEDQYATGINWDRVRILVDNIDYTGKEGHFSYDKDGRVTLSGYKWADGTHKVEVIAQDNFGNETNRIEYFNVNTDSAKIYIESKDEEGFLGGAINLELKSNKGTDIKSFISKVKVDKKYNIKDVKFSEKVKNFTWDYNKESGLIEIYGENNNLDNEESILANIEIEIPNTVDISSNISFEIINSTIDYISEKETNFIKTSSSKIGQVPIASAFNIYLEEVLVGKPAIIKVLDRSGNAVSDANIVAEYEDGSRNILGKTNFEGLLSSEELTNEVKRFSVYAEKDGLSSTILKSQSYAALKDIKPENILFGTTENPSTEKSVTWMTNPLTSGNKAVVQYIKKSDYNLKTPSKKKMKIKEINAEYKNLIFGGSSDIKLNGIVRLNKAKITGLKPDTAYMIRVGDGENWSEYMEFTTLKDKDNMKFVILGDTQSPSKEGLAELDKILNVIENQYSDSDAIIHLGDFIDDSSIFQQWDYISSLFNNYTKTNSIDMINVLGNHEYMGDPNAEKAKTIFNTPTNGIEENLDGVYSVDYNDVHFSVIGFTSDRELLEKKLEWLRNDVKNSDKKLKILLTHQPPYYTNPEGGNGLIKEMLPPVVDELGIDLVFSGHDHAYGRTKKLKNGVEDKNGAIYVVGGTTGQKHYQAVNDGSFEVYNDENTAIYTTLEYKDGDIQIIARKPDGTVVDDFTLDKKAPEITITGVKDKGVYKNSKIKIQVSVNEEAEITTTLNGEIYSGEEIVNPGKYEFVVVATDSSGNQSKKVINFKLKNHPKKDKTIN
ncbi:phosphodiester glycosidase family protein [Clostridium sp.]|uniref:phosphodiester glycosidase family protein n=1 Tax=Clostridium sp. TaxID=1506 RepID=UPI0029108A1C|nr:phosphodiester glycosidase family protein [Clostridium sp.]MDU5107482.1 phosphodiester glycosidase family protein [Clostridium sp.]